MVKELVKIGRQFNIFLKNKHNEPFFPSYYLLLFSTDPFIYPQKWMNIFSFNVPLKYIPKLTIGYIIE